jgi:RNA polymerase sigma-70 factor (ECF subfamily)
MQFTDSFLLWLGDYYLLSTGLLAITVLGIRVLKQPAHRQAITKGSLAGLCLLAALCALPRPSAIHLLEVDADAIAVQRSAAPPLTDSPAEIAAPRNAAVMSTVVASTSGRPAVAPTAPAFMLPEIKWTTAIMAAYFLGGALIAVRLIAGFAAANRLRHNAMLAPAKAIATLRTVTAASHAPSRCVNLLVSGEIDVAVALGIRCPAILLPATWLATSTVMSANEQSSGSISHTESLNGLRSVLAHEFAHIRNNDLAWLSVSRALFILLWAQPIYWLVRRQMRLDQEALADAAAAALTSREHYAEQLVAWARNLGCRPALQVASAVGLWEGASQLQQRIALLLNDRVSVLCECPLRWRTLSFLGCGAAAITSSMMTLQPGHSATQPTQQATPAVGPLDLNDQALITSANQILAASPNDVDALLSRAALYEGVGEDERAVADYERLIRLDLPPECAAAVHNRLAFILATSTNDNLRDGERAVELGEKAKHFQGRLSLEVMETLAAAAAETGDFACATRTQKQAIERAPDEARQKLQEMLMQYEAKQPRRRARSADDHQMAKQIGGRLKQSGKLRGFRIAVVFHDGVAFLSGSVASPEQRASAERIAEQCEGVTRVSSSLVCELKAEAQKPARTPTVLSYGDGKPDGKKSYGGNGHMIQFEMPEGVTKIKGIRIHGSRYGLPQAPNEDFEITFLSDKRDEVLHTESAPYKLFKRGKENWVRIAFDKEVELPRKFWIALDFNAEQTKGVYVSYDTSTKGKYSRVGKAGDENEPKETDFGGDWMVQVNLAPPPK